MSIPNKEVSKEYVNAISTMDWKDEFERNIIKERGEGHMKSLLILGAGWLRADGEGNSDPAGV